MVTSISLPVPVTENSFCITLVAGELGLVMVRRNFTVAPDFTFSLMAIDTDRMIAYREDGTLQNTSVTGKYEDLYLLEGENDIEITGGTVKVIPNWRCL